MASNQPGQPRVTVVVVTWNGAHLLGPCLDSLRTQTEPHHTIVVDNASTDQTPQLLTERHAELTALRLGTNAGFAGGAQAGLDAVTTPYAAFLNNDAVAEPQWLAALVRELDRDATVAAATSRMLLSADGRINNAGGALTRWGSGYDRGLGEPDGPGYDKAVDVAAFSGGACVLRTAEARRVGGFPADFFLYYEDTDLSWRLGRAGLRIRYVPDARVRHRHAASSDASSARFAFYNQRNQLLMLLRNAPWTLVAYSLGRYLAITLVRTIRPGTEYQARPGHRLRILAAAARGVPCALAARRAQRVFATVSRREFCRRWLGVEAR